MFGGIAIRNDCLYVAHDDSRARVSVLDLAARTRVFTIPVAPAGVRASCAGIAVSPMFTILVADPLARCVRIATPFGNVCAPVRGTDVEDPGHFPLSHDRRGVLAEPVAVATDARGAIYVASAGGPRVHSVQKFSHDGRFLGAFRAFGVPGEMFHSPRGIAVLRGDCARNCSTRVFVADTGNGSVHVFSSTGGFRQVFTTAIARGERSRPVAIAVGGGDELYILENGATADGEPLCELRRFSAGGEYRSTVIGGPALDAPVSLAVTLSGDYCILDRDGLRLRLFRAAGTMVADFSHFLAPETPADPTDHPDGGDLLENGSEQSYRRNP